MLEQRLELHGCRNSARNSALLLKLSPKATLCCATLSCDARQGRIPGRSREGSWEGNPRRGPWEGDPERGILGGESWEGNPGRGEPGRGRGPELTPILGLELSSRTSPELLTFTNDFSASVALTAPTPPGSTLALLAPASASISLDRPNKPSTLPLLREIEMCSFASSLCPGDPSPADCIHPLRPSSQPHSSASVALTPPWGRPNIPAPGSTRSTHMFNLQNGGGKRQVRRGEGAVSIVLFALRICECNGSGTALEDEVRLGSCCDVRCLGPWNATRGRVEPYRAAILSLQNSFCLSCSLQQYRKCPSDSKFHSNCAGCLRRVRIGWVSLRATAFMLGLT